MREYTIEQTRENVPLNGIVDGTAWRDASRLEVDQFNWYDGGPKPLTTARFLYDDASLYAQFQVEDSNITSGVTELNGPTFRDSSVELFVDPNPSAGTHYFNFEANCCGQFKLAWQENGWQERDIGRDLIPRDSAERVNIATSIEGSTREARPSDEGWWLAAEIPLSVLGEFTGVDVDPESSTSWRVNVYRSGVERESMKSTWNPMPTPAPDYHSPEFFGRFRFA